MRQFTTVVLPLTVKGFDMSGGHVCVTFSQGATTLEIEDPPRTFDGTDTTINVPLSQADTGSFQVGGVDVQINYWDAANDRSATDIKTLTIRRNQLNRVVEYD